MNINDISRGTKEFLFNTLDQLSATDSIIGFIRPIIKLGIENNFSKVTNMLKLIADENNNIDIEKLIDDIISSSLNRNVQTFPIGSIGAIEYGNNCLKFDIFNKYIKFDANDFIKLKNYLIENFK